MRTLEECRNEIFRIGEEKIRKRRKARKTAVLCAPIFVAAVLILGVILPDVGIEKNDSAAAEGANAAGVETAAPIVCDMAKIIETESGNITLKEGEEAENLHTVIKDICGKDELSSCDIEDENYRIVFYSEGREIESYIVSGKLLAVENSEYAAELNKEDLEKLKKIIAP